MTHSPNQTIRSDDEPGREPGAENSLDTSDAVLIAATDKGPPRKQSVGKRGDQHKEPERLCVVTRESMPQSKLVRFVLDPEGVVTPDVANRLPGRGAWVTASREHIELAVQKKVFQRAFKAQVKHPENLADLTENRLIARCLDLLGFAKRSGDLILGLEQVREEIRNTYPTCLIEASDGAEDGRKKVLALVKAIYFDDETEELPVIGCFSAMQLGLALGRERVIHAVLKSGRTGCLWVREAERLSGFRALRPDDWPSGSN